jgi:hypothetical protein
VDLALNQRNLREAGYATIQALLACRGYEQDPRQPFIFHRTVVVNGNPIKVEADFLAGEYEGTGRARKARGCGLAFDLYLETNIEPTARRRTGSGAHSCVISSRVPRHERHGASRPLKEKDAWDIYLHTNQLSSRS